MHDRNMKLREEMQVPELNYGVQLMQNRKQRINRNRLIAGLLPCGVLVCVIDDATDTHESAVYVPRRVLDKDDKTP